MKKLVDVTRPLARESKELPAALKESLAFLKKHRDRYLHLETIELDLMTTTSEKALRASVDREIRACVKAGAAVDALASDAEKAAKQLAAAATRRAKTPLDAFYGLSLDDDFDSTRDKKTRYALGLRTGRTCSTSRSGTGSSSSGRSATSGEPPLHFRLMPEGGSCGKPPLMPHSRWP